MHTAFTLQRANKLLTPNDLVISAGIKRSEQFAPSCYFIITILQSPCNTKKRTPANYRTLTDSESLV